MKRINSFDKPSCFESFEPASRNGDNDELFNSFGNLNETETYQEEDPLHQFFVN